MEINDIKNLIVKYTLGVISPEEKESLNRWICESKGNSDLFNKLTQTKFLNAAIGDRNKDLRKKEWKKLYRKTTGKNQSGIKYTILKVAAILMLPLFSGIIAWYFFSGNKPTVNLSQNEIKIYQDAPVIILSNGETISLITDSSFNKNVGNTIVINKKDTLNLLSSHTTSINTTSLEMHTVRIPRGGFHIVKLEDGSLVYLNAETEMQIPTHFTSTERRVKVSGEAYFEVTPDNKRKFIVETDHAEITVLGTEFNIRTFPEQDLTITTLVEGAVYMSNERFNVNMKPNQQLAMGKVSSELREVDVYPFIAWKSGWVVFQESTFEHIMKELQRWYEFDYEFEQEYLKNDIITAKIKRFENIDKIFDILEGTGKYNFIQNGKNVKITTYK